LTIFPSEDTIDVHVVKLSGIRIQAPVRRLRGGAEMPLSAMGTDEHQNAYSFGSAIPNLHLEWSLDDTDAGDLVSVFHRNGVAKGGVNEASVRFIAKRPGRAQIKLTARISRAVAGDGQFQLDGDRVFHRTMEIQVYLRAHTSYYFLHLIRGKNRRFFKM